MEHFEPLGIGAGSLLDGRYEIMRRVGSGGMSIVYEVRDRALNNDRFALKLFSPSLTENPTLLSRFRNEVSITRKLNHPNIIRTFDFGSLRNGQYYYMTMEFVEGKTLEEIIYNREGLPTLPFMSTLRILFEVSRGIAYAHEMGVTHRDLKPANVLVSEQGDIKVTDFGLAQAEQLDQKLTKAGECVGTPSYMSPEQIQEMPYDHRVDIYGLGILGYELAVGKVPFFKDTWYELAQMIISQPLPDFATKRNKIPEWYQEMIKKATAKKQDDRFQSVEEFIDVLQPHLGEAPTGDSILAVGKNTTRLELCRPVDPRRKIESEFKKVLPFLIIGLLIGTLIIGSIEALEPVMKKATEVAQPAKSGLDDFIDSVKKMRQVIVETAEMKPLINKSLENVNAVNQSAGGGGASLVPQENTVSEHIESQLARPQSQLDVAVQAPKP